MGVSQRDIRRQARPMQPYYILMKLPGSNTLEYLLMTPFTPQNRDNMIRGWQPARLPDYGKSYFTSFLRINWSMAQSDEAMIDQNPTISQQLTLWIRKVSCASRKLIVTPIENSFLYIVLSISKPRREFSAVETCYRRHR